MPRRPNTSPHTRAVLALFDDEPFRWRYGLAISKALGIKSGTLYPILMRLAEQGYLETAWEPSELAGRPARHAYRLTGQGRTFARERTNEPLPPLVRPALGET